jgi:Rod binding domain-containing protein
MNAASQISAVGATLAPSAGVSKVTSAGEPASVREGSPTAKQAYETARDFEEVLMNELSQELVKGSGLDGEGSDSIGGEEEGGAQEASAGGGESTLSSFLPQALTESMMRGGTLGIADQITRALDPPAMDPAKSAGASTPVGPTGGVES